MSASATPASVLEETPVPADLPEPSPRRYFVAAEAGTSIHVLFEQQLSTKETQEEQRFTAAMAKDLKVGGILVAPEGSVVDGVVRRVDAPGRASGRARLDLELTRIQTPLGWVQVTTEVVRKRKSGAGRDGATLGLGALLGAVVGGLADGRRGAARGAGPGAAAGAGAALATRGPDVVLKAGSRQKFRLKLPTLFEVARKEQDP